MGPAVRDAGGAAWRGACACFHVRIGTLRPLPPTPTPQAIMALLADPEPDSPLNCDAGNLLRAGDKRGFNSLARMYMMEHALGSASK